MGHAAHLLPQPAPKLLRHALGNTHGGHAAGLRAGDDALGSEASFSHVLSHLSCLARARLPNHNQDL
eukprot:scaffold32443_cov79-Isochrysis_galbana.AAC.1